MKSVDCACGILKKKKKERKKRKNDNTFHLASITWVQTHYTCHQEFSEIVPVVERMLFYT
jgi:hypothetical protein